MADDPEHQAGSGADLYSIYTAALEHLAEGVIIADAAGKLIFVNHAAEDIHGVKKLDVEPDDYSEAYQLLTMKGEPYPPHELPMAKAVIQGQTVENAHWRIRKPSGEEVVAIGTARPIMRQGKQIASVLTLRDDTERLERSSALTAALETKEILLKEINHRVKNSLQVAMSILNLQVMQAGDDTTSEILESVSERIGIMADVHKSLYETGGHDRMFLATYLKRLSRKTVAAFSSANEVALDFESVGDFELSVEKAVSIALGLTELIMNSLKHAFANQPEPKISIRLDANTERVKLTYRDNGCGLKAEARGAAPAGMGSIIINGLVDQLGAAVVRSSDEPGYFYELTIPRTPALTATLY